MRRAALMIAVAGIVGACSAPPLPEEGSADAQLYTERCGSCHVLYRPGVLKAKMWEAMVGRMETEMARRGVPLSPTDRDSILAYLKRNAGES